jgi:hypothetical protein
MTTFDHDIDMWTLAAVRAGPICFDDLVCHLPGVYPTEVRTSLDRLLAAGRINQVDWNRSVKRQPRPPAAPAPSSLPVPHPLDFDWRFASGALEALVAACDGLAGSAADVACVGAPSLHERLCAAGRPSVLVDANPDVIAAVRVFGADRAVHARVGCDALPDLTAPVVVIDPPWYPEHVRVFLWAASRLCTDGGSVLLSFPAAGTRPGVTDERDDALACAAQVGLVHEDTRRGELAYRSPPFERLALVAAGYTDLPEDWRRGDLLVFRALPGRTQATPPEPVVDDAEWIAIPGGSTRIKVRAPCTRRAMSAPVASRLRPLVPGDILPTVSRRDARRAEVAVWTACNRVFGCADTEVFIRVAAAIDHDADAVDAVAAAVGRGLAEDEIDEVRATEAQLVDLLEKERHDLEVCSWYTRVA